MNFTKIWKLFRGQIKPPQITICSTNSQKCKEALNKLTVKIRKQDQCLTKIGKNKNSKAKPILCGSSKKSVLLLGK